MQNPGSEALSSLNEEEVSFLKNLPKAELHAHLNGCIPLACLQELAKEHALQHPQAEDNTMAQGLRTLEQGVILQEIHDFFSLFPAIYALTSTPSALKTITKAVLRQFLEEGWLGPDEPAQCTYMELRTTPRQNENMSREQYLDAVLSEIELYSPEKVALIVSLDRRMDTQTTIECVQVAVKLKKEGRRIVGVDLCGTPTVGDPDSFHEALKLARENGLFITLHIAETISNSAEDTLSLLSVEPKRLGHATFLDSEARKIVLEKNIAIEICLSSNLLCKSVATLEDHHINYWLNNGLPLAICTDDTLPFRNTLVQEYAMLMAKPPLGLGLTRPVIETLASMSLQARFY